jgi:hypothetical protein
LKVRLARSAFATALLCSGAIALAGIVAGAVRVLPWLLDPSVSWRVTAPFARGLAAVAAESALLVGWPLGWVIACFRCVETGEARVLQLLGERPSVTTARLARQGAAFAAALAAVAVFYGRDAGAPGRVATELVAQARAACATVRYPKTYSVPFTRLTWLCAPGREPVVVGSLAAVMSSAVLSARDATISGDFRALQLRDARVLLPSNPPVSVHVSALSMHRMAPWAAASTLPPALRGFVLAASAAFASAFGVYAALRRAVRSRLGAIVLGTGGPLVALGLMRILERMGASAAIFCVVPFVGAAFPALIGVGLPRLRVALRARRRAASP